MSRNLSLSEKNTAEILMKDAGIPERCALSAAVIMRKTNLTDLISASIIQREEQTVYVNLVFAEGNYYAVFNDFIGIRIIRENNADGKIVFAWR